MYTHHKIIIIFVMLGICLFEATVFAELVLGANTSKEELINEQASFDAQIIQKKQSIAEMRIAARNALMNEKTFFNAQSIQKKQNIAEMTVVTQTKSMPINCGVGAGSTNSSKNLEGDAKTLNDIHHWFSNNQQTNTSGLIVSHPDDTSFIHHNGIQQEWAKITNNTQAFTYDQALAGIAMLNQGDIQGAKKIFDFYYSEWQKSPATFEGFWTVYNVDTNVAWKRYEWKKGTGENVWIGLFVLQYKNMLTGISQADLDESAKALNLATTIAQWIGTLPHHNGAVAMSVDKMEAGKPNFGKIYSVEHNLDYYAFLDLLRNPREVYYDNSPTTFNSKFSSLQNWLKTEAYDTTTGLFRRGGKVNAETGQFEWDPVKSLDVNSWAISAIGLSTLKNAFGIDLDSFYERIGQTFAIQDNGAFGGNTLNAKGFDFADSVNAASIGRSSMKWVEGTNQMILAYRMLADFYRPIVGIASNPEDSLKVAYYQKLADHFLSRNSDNAIQTGDALSYVYADKVNIQIYAGTGNWKTFTGQAAPSTSWVYFALNNINPFQAKKVLSPYLDGSNAANLGAESMPNEFLRKHPSNWKYDIIFSRIHGSGHTADYYVQIFNRITGKFEGIGRYTYDVRTLSNFIAFHDGQYFNYDDVGKKLTVNINGTDKILSIEDASMPSVPDTTLSFKVVNRDNKDVLVVSGLSNFGNKVSFEEKYPRGFLNNQNIRSVGNGVGNALVVHLANGTVDVMTSIYFSLQGERGQHISLKHVRKIIDAVTHPNNLIELKILTFGGATESVVINTISSKIVTRFVTTDISQKIPLQILSSTLWKRIKTPEGLVEIRRFREPNSNKISIYLYNRENNNWFATHDAMDISYGQIIMRILGTSPNIKNEWAVFATNTNSFFVASLRRQDMINTITLPTPGRIRRAVFLDSNTLEVVQNRYYRYRLDLSKNPIEIKPF